MSSGQPGLPVRDRANQESLYVLKTKYRRGKDPRFAQRMLELVGDDTLFQDADTVNDAYAISWAMMFYLSERDPKTLARVLQFTSARPTYSVYDRADRIRDFEKMTGVDPLDFSQRVSAF